LGIHRIQLILKLWKCKKTNLLRWNWLVYRSF